MSKKVRKITKKVSKLSTKKNSQSKLNKGKRQWSHLDFDPKNSTYKEYKEWRDILELLEFEHPLVKVELLKEIKYKDKLYPIVAFHIGSPDLSKPTLLINGGVHGLEKIGTHLIITYLKSLFKQLRWNKNLEKELKNKRLLAIPVINPAGMANNMRSNGNGVDIMRNAPIYSEEEFNFPLISGHSISPKLPWYRGNFSGKLEIESQVLIDFVKKNLFDASVSVAIDLHSGFGIKDRLWYPYATSRKKYPLYRETKNLLEIFEDTYPHHVYIIEQQSDSYTVHGDLWDYTFQLYFEKEPFKEKLYIPLCLEMGSWTWLRKNPKQIFNIDGIYNPIVEHRHNRVMRRHLYLLEFLFHIIDNRGAWG